MKVFVVTKQEGEDSDQNHSVVAVFLHKGAAMEKAMALEQDYKARTGGSLIFGSSYENYGIVEAEFFE